MRKLVTAVLTDAFCSEREVDVPSLLAHFQGFTEKHYWLNCDA
jgi:hypothetical protein